MATKKKTLLKDLFNGNVDETINFIQSKPKVAKDLSDEVFLTTLSVNPDQPRRNFNESELNELASSIKNIGLIQPIIINQDNIIVAGERRYRASKIAGLEKISVIRLSLTQQQLEEYSITENVQRVDLLPIEEAKAYKKLINKFLLTQEKISEKVGKSRSHIANILRLLNLPDYIQVAMNNNEISMGQAKPLLSIINNEKKIKEIFDLLIEKNLTSREVELLVNKANNPQKIFNKLVNKNDDIIAMERKLTTLLKTPVKIEKNKVIVSYNGVSDLNRLLELMNLLNEQ
ncbi:ParB/RepB/Spo0J family partition protein [Spiroplasma endosymbiont of Aspidapion aeneum]|uniref:ParB/RepB/Spo0J family partition protein n=1 Tax=Spiroplasma endosymbiont of Aspidapion aeneum TaxID=3066276 RepID=UPI00313D134A